ncbi:O-antigen ligase family protein [Melioribacteraceae bacterium 4301-Me]|uniref:O-antigen ligase family protein n=1 Tax=Pyranulibacter aquaticus TaxID=3163344 RepID=UPI003598D90D
MIFSTAIIKTDEIYKGFENTWYFYFVVAASIILIIVSVNFILPHLRKQNKITFPEGMDSHNPIDTFIVLFLFYSFLRLLFTPSETLDNKQFTILLFLTILYFIWKEFIKRNLTQERMLVPLVILISAFLLSGLIEAVLGILQLYDVMPGYVNSYFKVNGTFVNPDHYSGYLVSVIPFALGIYKFSEKKNAADKYLGYLALITFLTCIFILPSLKIRSSWIAVVIGVTAVYLFKNEIREKISKLTNSPVKKMSAVLLVVMLFVSAIIFLYKIKPASADGRLLIWKISSRIIKNNFIWGIGFNRYAVEYGNYQADYFDNEEGSEYERFIAGNVRQAHNEYLQIWAELGIVGLLLWIGIIISALWGYRRNDLPPPNNNLITGLKVSAKASLISLLVVSVFSFPLHILPTYINLVFMLSILSATLESSNAFSLKVFHFNVPYYLRTAFVIAAIAFASFTVAENYKLYNAYKLWKDAYELAAYGEYKGSIKKFEQAYPALKSEGEFLFNYGGVLMLNGKFEKAAALLEDSKKNYLDPKQYINLGICFENMNEFSKAEQSYKHAAKMEPNTLYPRYLLTKLYMKEKKYKLAKNECEKIISAKIKIKTTATQQMKEEIKSLSESIALRLASLTDSALSGAK